MLIFTKNDFIDLFVSVLTHLIAFKEIDKFDFLAVIEECRIHINGYRAADARVKTVKLLPNKTVTGHKTTGGIVAVVKAA